MLEIVHVPLGIEDPYRPLPWERAPREPEAGQQVAVGITTRRAARQRVVRVAGTADGATAAPVAARLVVQPTSKATIGGPRSARSRPASRCAYQGHAEGADDWHADTATHTFRFTSWRTYPARCSTGRSGRTSGSGSRGERRSAARC